jgi:protein gp37
MGIAARFSGPGQAYAGLAYRNDSGAHWTGKVRLIEDHLEDPLRWRKPRRIFVNSMSDLFHEALPKEDIIKVFQIMSRAPQHVFQILTKRPQRMLDMLKLMTFLRDSFRSPEWPLPHVWLGVSVEDQQTADERIPLLLQTPASIRWISAEPLLGPLNLKRYLSTFGCPDCVALNWVVVGGESGQDARPCNVENISSVVRQCRNARVPVFVKQLGAQPVDWRSDLPEAPPYEFFLSNPKGGDPSEWPSDLRVREFPIPQGGKR